MTPAAIKLLSITAIIWLAATQGDGSGRYGLRANGPVCVVAPCPSIRITDRTTGKVIYGDLKLDVAPPDNTGVIEISGADWDLLVDGEIHQDASTNNVPILSITKFVGRVPTK